MPDGGALDALSADLESVFARSTARLELILSAGLRRGLDPSRLGTDRQRAGDATLAYRERQLDQARAELARLRGDVGPRAAAAAARGYSSGLVAVDRTVGDALRLRGEFGRLHVGAINALAGSMARSLEAAVDRAGEHVELVFERAQSIEGALREGRSPAPGRFVGRRVDDPYRRAALEVLADSTIGLDTRRQASAMLARRLVTEGITDGLAGFVDAAGRRWSLPAYSSMVARTTTREAVTAGTLNRLEEGALDLVSITRHPHPHDVCSPYEGRTFSRTGRDPRYPPLEALPPFHPHCRHVLGPAAGNLDDFEAELEQAAALRSSTPPAFGAAPDDWRATALRHRGDVPEALEPGSPPFGADVKPQHFPDTPDAFNDQEAIRALIDADPGPEAEADRRRLLDARRDDRATGKALERTLGDELYKFINTAEGKRERLRERFLDGELDLDVLEELWYDRHARKEWNRVKRDVMDNELDRRPIPCFSCGSFKRRPADICRVCGDDPRPLGITEAEFNRGYGYAASESGIYQGRYGM